MTIVSKYNFGDIVFLITDREQSKRMVTGVQVRPTGIIYILSLGSIESSHYDFEIATDKNWK